MRLKLWLPAAAQQHKDTVTAAAWSPGNELFTCSDDNTIAKWSIAGQLLGKVCDVDTAVTDMCWFPSIGSQVSDVFAVSCVDGALGVARLAPRPLPLCCAWWRAAAWSGAAAGSSPRRAVTRAHSRAQAHSG